MSNRVQQIGDGKTTEFYLGIPDVNHVTVRHTENGLVINPEIFITSTGVTVKFLTPPAVNQFTVACI